MPRQPFGQNVPIEGQTWSLKQPLGGCERQKRRRQKEGAEVRTRGGLDTAAGENYGTAWEFRRAFEAGAITYAQPSVTKIGGVTEMRRIMALAETFGIQVVPHSAYFGPGLLASIHCIAAMPTESLVERFYCDFADNPLGDAIHPKLGRITVPQGPGLGVDPDSRLLAKLRTA